MATPKKRAPAKKAASKPKAEKALTPWQKWKAQPDAIDVLCKAIAAGDNVWAYSQANGFAYSTLREWIDADKGRADKYARAREDRADKLADEIVAISDEVEVAARYDGEDVKLAMDAAAVARNRLRVDARKWVAAKLKPRTYGDKIELGGEVGLRSLPDDQLKAEIARLSAKLGVAGPANA